MTQVNCLREQLTRLQLLSTENLSCAPLHPSISRDKEISDLPKASQPAQKSHENIGFSEFHCISRTVIFPYPVPVCTLFVYVRERGTDSSRVGHTHWKGLNSTIFLWVHNSCLKLLCSEFTVTPALQAEESDMSQDCRGHQKTRSEAALDRTQRQSMGLPLS